MTTQPQIFEELHARLFKLENQNRKLTKLGIVGLIGFTLLLAMGQAPAKKTVEASEFILKDGNGNVRARLRMGGDFFAVPELDLIDEKGTNRVTVRGGLDRVGGPANFSGISVFDEHGRERGMFDANENGAALAFINVKGTDDALVRAEGIFVSGPVTVSDEQGFRATLGETELVTPKSGETHKTSAASLVLFGKDKSVIWRAP
jgi:hypothetical protein